jgi:hypothetical protein
MREEKGGVLRQVQHLPGVLLQGRQDASRQQKDEFGEEKKLIKFSENDKISSVKADEFGGKEIDQLQ